MSNSNPIQLGHGLLFGQDPPFRLCAGLSIPESRRKEAPNGLEVEEAIPAVGQDRGSDLSNLSMRVQGCIVHMNGQNR